ncbi:MAG: hypothetical protein ACK5MD_10000 [Flavobacteriales bacterium]
MKYFFTILSLLFFHSLFSQVKQRTEYQSYYIKQPKFTGNQVVKMDYKSVFLNLEDGNYVVEIKLTDQDFMQAKVKYTKTIDFARQTIYIYEGRGSLYLQPMNFVIESTIKLSELCKGNAYVGETDNAISNYGVHILYWSVNIREPMQKNNFTVYPIQNEQVENVEIEEEYINPLQQYLSNNYTVCQQQTVKSLNVNSFDAELDYETTSYQIIYCKNDEEIAFDFLPEEGLDGFYYATFRSIPYTEVLKIVLKSYNLTFKTDVLEEQKHIDSKDDNSYTIMRQSFKENQKTAEIKSFYKDNSEGNYIRVEQKPNNTIQVHISYNGV